MSRNGMSRRALLGNIAMLGVASGPGRAFAGESVRSPIQRDFNDPNLELIRLLREAAEIEQDLMVQYLYGAFSLKPAYMGLVGGPAANASSFMGVVIQEMQHLGAVNRLLVELESAPVLARQDFPYESDIYPFAFELVPLGQSSLAKFTYCEASPDTLPKVHVTGDESVRLLDHLKNTLGGSIPPNYVGHLYDAVIDTLGEVKKAGGTRLDFDAWSESLEHIKTEGEVGHFQFFQSVYEGSHPLLKETPGVWSLPANDARHPCYQVPVNPTAYVGHANCIADPDLRAMAWLGNLNYWVMLSLLDAGYRRKSKSKTNVELSLAQTVMMGPLWSLARQLPAKGAAVPFDPLSMGFEPGLNSKSEQRFTRRLLEETRDYTRSIQHLLPADIRPEFYDQLLASL
jgi:rubrerythrin